MSKNNDRGEVPNGYTRETTDVREKGVDPRIDRQDIALMLIAAVLAVMLGIAAVWIGLH